MDTTPIAIVGAGPVGMTLALALARAGRRCLLLDARPAAASAGDPRALALAEGSRQLLERVGAWPATAATAIREVHVSQRGGFGRTLLRADEMQLPALGYVVAYGEVCRALEAAVAARPEIELRRQAPLLASTADHAGVTLASGAGEFRAALVVHAEGAGEAGTEVFDYGQDAILLDAEPLQPHAGRAWERFTADGPLALLPHGRRYALVFVCRRDATDALLQLDDSGIGGEIEARLSGRVRFAGLGPRSRVPLLLRVRRQPAVGRELWIGNAAQTLHPVSGQGLNLGLRDAWELAMALAAADPRTDPLPAIGAYTRRRRLDRFGGIGFTDGIVRIFSNDLAPLRVARGLGLAALDLLPPARRFLAERMIFGTRI